MMLFDIPTPVAIELPNQNNNSDCFLDTDLNKVVKSQKTPFFVIPAEAGIQ